MTDHEAAVGIAAANLTEIAEAAIRFHEHRARQLRQLLHHVGAVVAMADEEGSDEEDKGIAALAERFQPKTEDERKAG